CGATTRSRTWSGAWGRTSRSTTTSGCTSRSGTGRPPRCTAGQAAEPARSSEESPVSGLDNGVHQSLHEPELSRGKAWLTTLIETGYPLRRDRQPPPEPAGGGLLTVQMETEVHVFVVHR